MEDNIIQYTIYKLKEKYYDLHIGKCSAKEHEHLMERLKAIKNAIDTINSEIID